jgi:multiple sugar transport system ATP-binding protein
VAPATNRNLQADVSHSEVLGNEQLITCRLLDGGHLVQVRADPGLKAIPGSRIHLDADPHGWRLFDDQGDAIPMPAPPSERDDKPVLPDLN